MTPLHMEHGGAELRVIGFVISVHVLGMFAFSPLVGWLADKAGRPPVLGAGGVSPARGPGAVPASPEGSSWQIFAGLFLLGLGWSFATVAASTLIADHAPLDARTDVQGAADLVMGLTAAVGRRARRRGGRRVRLPDPRARRGRRSPSWSWWPRLVAAQSTAIKAGCPGERRARPSCRDRPSSAGRASTPSSTTPRTSSSRRRTAPLGDRSPSATVAGRRVAFLPRHGPHHEHPPHAINYRANVWALRSLGVRQVLAPLRRRRACGPRSRPVTSSCPTSSSTAPRGGCRASSRAAPCTCPSPTRTARG